MNFHGGIIEERFAPVAVRPGSSNANPPIPPDFRKLRQVADLHLQSVREPLGIRGFFDFEDTDLPGGLPGQPLDPPPAARFRLRRGVPARMLMYSLDHYPILAEEEELVANLVRAFPHLDGGDITLLRRELRDRLDQRDPIRALHAFERFMHEILQVKSAQEGSSPFRKLQFFFFFWCQMFGAPWAPGLKSLRLGEAVYADLPPDPDAPAPNDSWELRKPRARKARLQAWMPILMGAEGVAWFAQHFIDDALIYLLYNPIAAEIHRYAPLRVNGRLISKRLPRNIEEEPGVISTDPLAGQYYMAWQLASAPLASDAQGNARELIRIGDGPLIPAGRLELGFACGILQGAWEDQTDTTKQMLFLANPSFRARTVRLNVTGMEKQADPAERWQLYQFGEAIVPGGEYPYSFPVAGIVDLTLEPQEDRSYERELPPEP